MKQTLKTTVLSIIACAGVLQVFTPTPVVAAVDCAILPKSICNAANSEMKDDNANANVANSGVFALLKFILQIMTALVGVVATISLVVAGIFYASASGNAEQVSRAKGMITNTVIGIIAYALMFLVLNWLIPGGVLR